MHLNKRFNQSLKDQHDGNGKRLAAEIMRDLANATLLTDNKKEDAGDFSAGFWDQAYTLPSGKLVLVEPEMKDKKWWGPHFHADRPFRYDDVDIPYRKVKNSAHLHMVISTCNNYAFLVTRKAMDAHLAESGGSPKFKKTMYESDPAPYFSTPVDKGFFVHKENGHWKRWIPKVQLAN